jgi:hypothetical protein
VYGDGRKREYDVAPQRPVHEPLPCATVRTRVGCCRDPPHDPRPTLAREPDHVALDAGLQLPAAVVVGEEGVEVGERAHGQPAYLNAPAVREVPR